MIKSTGFSINASIILEKRAYDEKQGSEIVACPRNGQLLYRSYTVIFQPSPLSVIAALTKTFATVKL